MAANQTHPETVCLTLREYQQVKKCCAALTGVVALFTDHPRPAEEGGHEALQIIVQHFNTVINDIANRRHAESQKGGGGTS